MVDKGAAPPRGVAIHEGEGKAKANKTVLLVAGMALLIGGAWIYSNASSDGDSRVRDVPPAERMAMSELLKEAQYTTSGGLTFLVGRVDEKEWEALDPEAKREVARAVRNALEGTEVVSARIFSGRSLAIAVRGRRYQFH